jgi:hypothetical protein
MKMYRSKKYREWICSQPSLYSGKWATDNDQAVAHHTGAHGIGIKAPDTFCVPLLQSEHVELHLVGARTFWGNQYDALPLRCLEYVTKWLEEA